MNRQQFFTLGGALLASTALSSGAMAGTAGIFSNATGTDVTFSSTALKVSNTLFSTTAATADTVVVGGPTAYIGASFCSSCDVPTGLAFNIDITVTNAQPVQSSINSTSVKLLARTGSTSFSATLSGTSTLGSCTGAFSFGSTIYVTGCQTNTAVGGFSTIGGVVFSGLQFNTANALATVGQSISLSGKVYTPNGGPTYDTFAGAVITSASPVVVSVTPGANTIIAPLSTPRAFAYLSDTQVGSTGVFSMVLATVVITSAANVLSANLGGLNNLTSSFSSVNVTVTSGVLTPAVAAVSAYTGAGALLAGTTATTANFASANVLTFSLAPGVITNTAFSISVAFNGSIQIPSAPTAGTVAIKFGAFDANSQAPASPANGATATATRGGFSGELNTVYSSAILGGYTSFVRIHNNGATDGAATIIVVNDATGLGLGSSFTTSVITAGSTLQLSSAALEAGAGITAPAGLYTVKVSGPFIGYVQHVIYNPTTGQINDLSSFRNAGAANAP